MKNMEFDSLLISQGLQMVSEGIDEIDSSLLKGLAIIVAFLIGLWFVGYFLGFQAFNGHWKRSAIIIGAWLFLEFAYYLGGGHNKK
jgi:hypothetical protein